MVDVVAAADNLKEVVERLGLDVTSEAETLAILADIVTEFGDPVYETTVDEDGLISLKIMMGLPHTKQETRQQEVLITEQKVMVLRTKKGHGIRYREYIETTVINGHNTSMDRDGAIDFLAKISHVRPSELRKAIEDMAARAARAPLPAGAFETTIREVVAHYGKPASVAQAAIDAAELASASSDKASAITAEQVAEQPRPATSAAAAQVFAEAAAKSSRRNRRYVFTKDELRDPDAINRARDTLSDIETARSKGMEISDEQRQASNRAKAFIRRVAQLNAA